MKRTLMIVLFAAAMATLASLALADSTPGIDARKANQHARIREGVHSGQLTRGEAANLRAGQRHVNRVERRAKADGVVTPRERARITAAQNHQSSKIYRKKHNARTRVM
ncbi:MAG TPA: hypothetical protein VMJ70_00925 [Candidatus Sulfotelmatobacter sp.]|nr:hypothetical protein [Candidatus Sulfotelmatobacter sp.]